MKIIDRYIFSDFVKSVFYCLAVFIFLYIMADLFNFIDEMIRNRAPLGSILVYYMNYIPKIFVDVTPVAVLLSTVYILSNFNRHNEITALRASGVGILSIIRPLLVSGFLLSIVVFLVNDKIVPQSLAISNKIGKEQIRETDKKKAKNDVLNNVAIYGSKNRIIYVRSFDTKANLLREIIILEHDENQNLVSKYAAHHARWENNKWVFYNFSSYRLDSKGDIIGNPFYAAKKVFDLDETPDDFKRPQWRAEFMSYKELKTYIERFSRSGLKTARELLVDLYYKVAFSFITVIVILVASPLALLSSRGGILIGIAISILFALCYYAMAAISLALGKTGALPPFMSAWLPNLAFLVLGIYLIKKRK